MNPPFPLAKVNAKRLLRALEMRPQLWQRDTYMHVYPGCAPGEGESITLRFPEKCAIEHQATLDDNNRVESKFDQHECIDCPPYAKLPEARPFVMHILSKMMGERLGRVMINKVRPGGRLLHQGGSAKHAAYYTRFHLVLQSKPGARFRGGPEGIDMNPGQVWWLGSGDAYELVNSSSVDQIHLEMEAKSYK